MSSKHSQPSRGGIAAVITSAVLMATIGVISRQTGIAAESVTFFRLVFGAFFMLVFLIATSELSLIARKPPRSVLVNGVMLAGFIVAYIQAMNHTTMANAILLVYLAPLLAAAVAHLFLGERLARRGLLYVALALVGFVMVLEFRVDLFASHHATGLAFGLLAMAAYAAFILINRRQPPDLHPYTSTFYQLLTGAVVMLPFAMGEPWAFSGEQWLWLAGAGLFPGFFAILLAVLALKKLRAATFGTLAYFEPLAVVFFGAAFFGESLTPLQMGGCALIFVGGIAAARS